MDLFLYLALLLPAIALVSSRPRDSAGVSKAIREADDYDDMDEDYYEDYDEMDEEANGVDEEPNGLDEEANEVDEEANEVDEEANEVEEEENEVNEEANEEDEEANEVDEEANEVDEEANEVDEEANKVDEEDYEDYEDYEEEENEMDEEVNEVDEEANEVDEEANEVDEEDYKEEELDGKGKWFYIKSQSGGLVIEETGKDKPLVANPESGVNGQLWRWQGKSLISKNNLAIDRARPKNDDWYEGAIIIGWPAEEGNTNQQWKFENDRIVWAGRWDLFVEIGDSVAAAGTEVFASHEKHEQKQFWTLSYIK